MTVLRWLGYITLACIALAVLMAVVMALKILALVGGVVIAVAFIAMSLKSYSDERRRAKRSSHGTPERRGC